MVRASRERAPGAFLGNSMQGATVQRYGYTLQYSKESLQIQLAFHDIELYIIHINRQGENPCSRRRLLNSETTRNDTSIKWKKGKAWRYTVTACRRPFSCR